MEQCVMTAGTMKMPQSSAHNLDSHDMVHKIHVDYVKICVCSSFHLLCSDYMFVYAPLHK